MQRDQPQSMPESFAGHVTSLVATKAYSWRKFKRLERSRLSESQDKFKFNSIVAGSKGNSDDQRRAPPPVMSKNTSLSTESLPLKRYNLQDSHRRLGKRLVLSLFVAWKDLTVSKSRHNEIIAKLDVYLSHTTPRFDVAIKPPEGDTVGTLPRFDVAINPFKGDTRVRAHHQIISTTEHGLRLIRLFNLPCGERPCARWVQSTFGQDVASSRKRKGSQDLRRRRKRPRCSPWPGHTGDRPSGCQRAEANMEILHLVM